MKTKVNKKIFILRYEIAGVDCTWCTYNCLTIEQAITEFKKYFGYDSEDYLIYEIIETWRVRYI